VARFLRQGGRLKQIASGFTGLRKSRKGQPVAEVFKQLICFFFDGTRRYVVHFDQMKQDAGHAALIETDLRRVKRDRDRPGEPGARVRRGYVR